MPHALRGALFAVVLVVMSGFSTLNASAEDLAYYLGEGIAFDERVPAPADYFGFEVGDRHLRHHELAGYMRALAEASDRVSIEEYGRTHGNRPLLVLTITSEENHGRLEEIRQNHINLTDPQTSHTVDVANQPVVIHLCYSVHGDEPSGSNAAPVVAYYLAAGRGEKIEQLLDNAVILLDPSLNPDGFDRFAHWANMYHGHVTNIDENHREHNQDWPGGRTNYYFFDLNRDWLPARHPESQGRLRIYHRWKPNILNDYHEMGTDSTYFFQPGVPERKNPLTPHRNVELTERIAAYHGEALDQIGSAYFTEERFDDFYMGKGSTYPDLHGAIGILFEQASSRGHAQESDSPHGVLRFPFTIRNQVRTSLSTFDAAIELREELLSYLRDFYTQSLKLGEAAALAGYIFTAPNDAPRARTFLDLLRLHDIEVRVLTEPATLEGEVYPAERSYFVPAAQPEFRFVQSIFERRTEFEESVFYDVSAWTPPLAFNLQYRQLSPEQAGQLAHEEIDSGQPRSQNRALQRSNVAYVIDWRSSNAPAVVYRLLDAGVHIRVAQKPFEMQTPRGVVALGYGAVLVPVGPQRDKAQTIHNILKHAVQQEEVVVHPAASGLTPQGIDLGSGSFAEVKKPKVILLCGEGTSSYGVGEVWHELDHRLGVPVTLVGLDRLGGLDLHDYTTVIMPDGSYRALSDSAKNNLQRWMRRQGGTIVALEGGVAACARLELCDVEFREREDGGESGEDEDEKEPVERRPYVDAEKDRAKHRIAGAIFNALIDTTHPVAYGYETQTLPVFLKEASFIEPSDDPYSTPLAYAEPPLLSGYASTENIETMIGSGVVVIDEQGRGRVVMMMCDPLFRAHWHGTTRLVINSVFFGSTIREPGGSRYGRDLHGAGE